MKSNKLPQEVQNLLSQVSLPSAEYVGQWNGYAVYHPVYGERQPSISGLPSYILLKSGVARWTEDGEGFQILEQLLQEEKA